MIRVAVVGLGLIGAERVAAITALSRRGHGVAVCGVLDPDRERAQAGAALSGAEVAADLEGLIAMRPDWFIVATPHHTAAELVPRLLASGAHVLVEKPLGRDLVEAEALLAASTREGQLWVGLNYRFFEGVSALIADVRRGAFGRPIAVDAIVGHGGSPGMEATWKLDPVRAGGGALIDPGIHLLDLAQLIAGERLDVRGATAWEGFWRTGVEEECHLLLVGQTFPAVNLQISIVRWRSTFRLEFHGEDGYGIVEGRGRSYGPQTYRRGRRWGWRDGTTQAASEEQIVETSGDNVLERELEALLLPGDAHGTILPCGGPEAVAGMRLLQECRSTLGLPSPDGIAPTVTQGEHHR